jgi:hypothetical protein
MPTVVPDRGDNPRRKVNFYTPEGQLSHSADVRWVGDKYKKPHAGDIKKNTKKLGGYKNWEVAD